MIRDALMQSLVAGLGVGTQSYRPCVLFINGEFWESTIYGKPLMNILSGITTTWTLMKL